MPSKLSLVDTVKYAGRRLATRGGALLVGVYLLYQLVTQVAVQSLVAAIMRSRVPTEPAGSPFPLAVDLPATVAGAGTLILVLAGTFLSIVAIRALYTDIDDLPTANHLRRPGRTLAVTLVVSVIVTVAITVGMILLFLPGIFLAVCLVFAVVAVAIEDAGVLEALKRSWSLTSGNRLRLFVLGLLVVALSVLSGALSSGLGLVFPVVGDVTSALLTGLVSLFGLAVLVGAYRQLAEHTAQPSSSV